MFRINDLKHTGTIQFPKGTPVSSRFNFAYSNRTFWFFDKDARVWKGYQIK
jgi:hypothetical protein